MQIIKRLTNKITTIALVIALSVAMAVCAFSLKLGTAKASADDTKVFEPTDLGIGNTDFRDSSGSYPATPTNWTGNHVGAGNGEVVSGVVDLTTSTYNNENDDKKGNEKYKLDQYPEYANGDIPRTVFGTSDHAGTDAKTLLINTPKGSETAYAYTSSSVTFAPDSFYSVSAWVKTGDFAGGTGATIKLNGLGANCAFYNINTVAGLNRDGAGVPVLDKSNDFGWKKYTFFVRTGYSISRTVTLSLGIGDAYLGNEEDSETVVPRTAHGYAFFDNVVAEQISAETYAFITTNFAPDAERDNVYYDNTKTSMVLDLYDGEYLKDGNTTIGTFSDENLVGWNKNASYNDDEDENIEYGGAANAFYYNADEDQNVDKDDNGKIQNSYGMTRNPWTPYGRAESQVAATDITGYNPFATDNAGILVLSTRSNGEFATSAIGVASPDVVIEQYKYYRFGVWVKGDGISGGNGISIGVKGASNIAGNYNKLNQWYNNLDGDASDNSHYGWKEQIVYIQGSMLSDLTVHFELWLGSPTQKSSGIAYFDNVTFKELSYSEFSALSAADGGNIITLDGTVEDTGISNGNFMSVETSDDMSFPLPVADWTFFTAESVETAGFAKNPVNTDKAVHGIIPTDETTFDKIPAKDIPGIVNPASFGSSDDLAFYSALVLSSSEKTAICYSSPTVTLNSGSGYQFYVDMAVGAINGYGASIVLKSNDAVISTIEGIKSTNGAYNRYTFYIDELTATQSASIEIWLGLNDRVNNSFKLSAGSVYVKRVGMETWEVDEGVTVNQEYANILEQYKTDIRVPSRLANMEYGVYSFNAPLLDYYDPYSYNIIGGLGTPYQWSVSTVTSGGMKAGIFDSANPPSEVYAGFERKDYTGNMLYIANTSPNRTTYTYDNTVTLAEETYYRLDVTAKVYIPEGDEINPDTAVGACIKITGSKESAFTDIKDTSSYVIPGREDTRDKESFKTYSFYIATGSVGGSMGLEFTLGGENFTQYIQGALIVADINLTTITNITFEEVEEELKDSDYADATRKVIRITADSDEETPGNEDDQQSGDIAWWIIPTVIFSACLVIAIIVVAAMKIKETVDKKRKHNKKYANEYDRNEAMKKIDELKADDEKTDDKPVKTETDLDDDFNDNSETGEYSAPTDEVSERSEESATAETTETADDEAKETEKSTANESDEEKPSSPAPSDDLDD